MHTLGVGGQMRRLYDPTKYDFLIPQQPLNVFISVSAFLLFAAQLILLVNFFVSIFAGRRVTEKNPWNATTLEWTVPSPTGHGNFGDELPTVHRWAFDYSVPGAAEDFIPQDVAPVAAQK
jgi:cytochrome c oxidase subunit 1